MNDFKKCINGHFYKKTLGQCPFCPIPNVEQQKFKDDLFLKPINFGLIILSVIDGIVYGKTSNYIIPTGGTAKNVKLITEPLVYIDYGNANVENKEGIPFWKSFLEKCLAFEQRNRFHNMDSFMNEYNRLIELYPLKGNIEFRPNFGDLSLVKINGEFEAAWFVQ